MGDFAMYMRSVFSDLEINGEVTVDRNCDYLVVEEAKGTCLDRSYPAVRGNVLLDPLHDLEMSIVATI